MANSVGSIKITLDIDASDLSSQITSQVQTAMRRADSAVSSGVSSMSRSLGQVNADGLNNVSRAADTAMSSTTRSVSSGMASVSSSLNKVDASGLSDIGKAAEAASSTASRSISSASSSASSSLSSISTQGLSNVTSAAETASSSVGRIGSAASGARDSLGRFTGSSKSATKATKEMGDSAAGAGAAAAGMGSVMRGGLLKVAGPIGAAVSSFNLLSGAISRASDTAAAEASLTGLYDSAADAADMMGRITAISRDSSIDTGAYTKMAQSLGYLGVKGQQSEDIMRNLGKVIVGAGGDSSAFDTVSDALTRMQNEGKVTRETLTQLSGAGVPILDALATKLGKEVPEVLDMVTKGAIDVDDVLGVLQDGTGKWMEQLIVAGDEVDNTFGARWSKAKDQVMEALGGAILPVMNALGPVITWLGDGLTSFLNLLSGGADAAGPFSGAMSGIKDVLGSVGDFIAPAVEGVKALWSAFTGGDSGGAAESGWMKSMTDLGAKLRDTFDSLMDVLGRFWTDTVQPVFSQIGRLVADVWTGTLQPVLTRFVEVLTSTVFPAILNLWQNVALPAISKFGELVKATWDGILGPVFRLLVNILQNVVAPVVMWLWQSVIAPAFTFIGNVISVMWSIASPILSVFIAVIGNLGTIVGWLWTNVMVPAWNGIASVISVAWNTFVLPIFNAFKVGVTLLGNAALWLWNNVITPAWNGIAAIISWAWNTLVLPVFNAFKAGVTLLGNAALWLWNNVITPAWNGIGNVISWVWNNIIQPAWTVLKAELDGIGQMFSWVWNNVISPVWNALGDGIRWVVDNIVLPAWDTMRGALDTLGRWFDSTVGFIQSMWDRIKGIVAAPINFVIDVVYNNGIKAVWDKVAGWLGLDPLPLAQRIAGYATGGVYPGYTPGRDIGMIGVSGGEAIMRPEWTRAMGPGYVEEANRAARMGGVSGVRQFMGGPRYLGGYWLGGVIDKVKDTAGTVWDNTGGKAVSAVNSAGEFIDDTVKSVARLGFKKTVEFFFDKIVNPIGDLIPQWGGMIGQVPRKAFEYMSESTKAFLLQLAGLRDDAEAHHEYDPSAGVEQWTGVVRKALELEGFPVDDAHIQATLAQIASESGGDPNITQQVQDVNSGGNEAQGLVQVTPATAADLGLAELGGDIHDPLTNLRLGMRRIKSAWGGDLLGTWGHGHGYARGGLALGPGTGTSDDILARLSNGEFVVNAKATADNLPLLQAINAGWTPPAALLHEMLPAFATGGLVSIDELIDFARGVEGQPYEWGGIQWGDCSGAVAALARYATGLDPWGGRFATSNEGDALAQMGFQPGIGPPGSLSIGWYNGGPWGGHTAATLPDGTHFEMGGARGNGQFGGAAVGADWSEFTDHMHLGPEFFIGGDPQEVPGVGDWADGAAANVAAAAAAHGPGVSVSSGAGAGAAAGGVGTTAGTGGAGVSGAASGVSGAVGTGAVVDAIDTQTGVMTGIAEDQDKTWEDYHKEQMAALKAQVDAWAHDAIRVPVRDALTDALGSQEADKFAMVLASGVGDTVADLVNTVQDKFVSAITDIITDLVQNLAEGALDAAFGTRDEDKYGDPILQAIMKTVGVSKDALDLMYATSDTLQDIYKDRDKAFSQMGRILSDNSQIIQRNTSSRERVEAERDDAMQKIVEGTIRTAVTKIIIPIITAVLSALITAAFAALGAAIGSIVPGLGTGIGAAIGGSIGAGISAATAGMMSGAMGGMFDSGGIATGVGFMPKATLAPERVLSPRETSAFERLVDHLTSNPGGMRNTVHAPIHMHGARATGQDVQDRLLKLMNN